MAKSIKTNIQSYPRIDEEENSYHGFFDDSKVTQHKQKISNKKLKEIISKAVKTANLKSSRAILNIGDNISEEELNKIYIKEGKALFKYFLKYCGDPASTAFDCVNQHFSKIAREQFRNRTIQKERMKLERMSSTIQNSSKKLLIYFSDKSEYHKIVLDALFKNKYKKINSENLDERIIHEFGHQCDKNNLLKDGYFADPYKLAALFLKSQK